MNNPTKATTPADVVSVVAHTLGFTPQSSIVLMFLTGTSLSATVRINANPEMPTAQMSRMMRDYAGIADGSNATILVSFEDDKALTIAQYEAMGDALAAEGAPLVSGVLVTDGQIMDYDGDSTDAVPFDNATTSPTALELHMRRTKPQQLAADVPACKDEAGQAEAINEHERAGTSVQVDDEARSSAVGTLQDIVDGYTISDTVTADHAAWIAGTMKRPLLRDVLAASLSTSETDNHSLEEAMLGNSIPENWEYLNNASRMLYAALAFIPNDKRANVLCIIGWTRWMDAKSSQAAEFFQLALEAEPGHHLAGLLTKRNNLGILSRAALTRH